jgi:hypothetical protein
MSMKPGHTISPAGTVDDFGAVRLQVLADLRNAIAVDQHVEDAVPAIGRVNDPPALQKPLHALPFQIKQ